MSGRWALLCFECVLVEGPDRLVVALCGYGIGCRGIVRDFAGERAGLGDPLVAAAIHDLHLVVTEEAEDPEGVAGPPVRLVPVEDDGRVALDAVFLAERGEGLGRDVVAHGLVLKVGAPVDVHGAGDVAGGVKKDVLVALDDADGGVVEMLGDPFRGHESLGMCVVGIGHREMGYGSNFNRLGGM